MTHWEVIGHEGESPRNSQSGHKGIGSSLSGLRLGCEKFVLDAGVVYANANVTTMLAHTKDWDKALNTWTDANGQLVHPRLLGDSRRTLYGTLGSCLRCQG